jgi:hypothetical protein
MSAPHDYVPMSFWLPKSLRDQLRRKYPKYGELSRVLRVLAQRLADGRLRIEQK